MELDRFSPTYQSLNLYLVSHFIMFIHYNLYIVYRSELKCQKPMHLFVNISIIFIAQHKPNPQPETTQSKLVSTLKCQ